MILHRYIARRFAAAFLAILATFFLLTFFIELIEQARRHSDEAGFVALVELSLLALPGTLYELLPIVAILATVTLFIGLARSSELVVTRASGRSALRALVAPVLVTLVLGAAALAVLNPLSAATAREYEARTMALTGTTPVQALAEGGLWLRQGGAEGQSVIHAGRASLDGTELSDVSFLTYAAGDRPVERLRAEEARLVPGAWELAGVKRWPLDAPNPEAASEVLATLSLPSSLTADSIRDSFGTPASIPIWELPRFISELRAAGFSARRHLVHLQLELATPLFLVAMVLIGALFTMRHQRGGRTGMMILFAILLGFATYFVRNFARVLGESGDIPAGLAAWAPPAAAIALALGFILHLEDG
ncbi:LPS export ABC transporter permease LptG [Pseudoroseicyclus tamaricis]|uniref:LPS export ABC transporter permease LptG n=1 Tax=Pseudoroseicyclus tamaricis TaxID=2705421 RepID=A0A6B2JZD2_9RHOB|nr:LPS export ABC transporter permease LptG [Pseudoroseicyclus tamaricis]NDV01624.1 LPS export ABC transporter permease LptG [Pseudoroseicyclus tamaricis]